MATTSLARSGISNFQKYSSLLVGNPSFVPSAFDLLQTTVVGAGGLTAVEFTNLTSTYGSAYQHLQIRAAVRTSRASLADDIFIQLNTDTGSNYSNHAMIGSGPSVTSYGAANSTSIGGYSVVAGNSSASGIFSPMVLDLLDPFSTEKNKTVRQLMGLNSAGEQWVILRSGLYRSLSSTASIKLFTSSGAGWAQGTRFSLYGIKAVA